MPELAIDDLSESVINCAMKVHSELGPGLLESIYRDCLKIELVSSGFTVQTEKQVPVFYRGQRIRSDLRVDLLVDGRLVVEVKAIERLHPVHQAQVITYLKLTACPASLLFNFNATSVRSGMKRLDHPDVYAEKMKARRAHKRLSS